MEWFKWVNLILGLYMAWMFITSFSTREKLNNILWQGLKHWGWKIGYGIMMALNIGAFIIRLV